MTSYRSLPATAGVFTLLLVSAAQGFAQTSVATDPVGYASLPLLANSDSLISIPFTRPTAFAGAIGSISSNTITLASSPGWTVNQFVYVAGTQSNTYYAIIGPNIAPVSGTVSLTNGTTAVTATSGLSSMVPGDELLVNGLAYNVASVTSDTAAVLSRAYTGSTGSGLAATYDHSPKEGSYYTVTASGTNTLTVNLNGDSLSTVAVGTSVSLIPYWTLSTAFPANDAGTSYIASTSTGIGGRATQIFLPDLTDAGVNLAPTSAYYNYNNFWHLVGGNITVSHNDTILLPSSYFIVRNFTTPTTFTPIGGVYMNRLSVALDTEGSSQQDNEVAVNRPTAFTLNDLDLITSGAFVASTSSGIAGRADQLFVYDNTVSGINKAPSATYYYRAGAWRLVGGNITTDYGSTTIPCGTGFTIRKARNSTGSTVFWQNTRNY